MTPVPSPCINLCEMDQASGFCRGCMRTIDEIMAWGQSSEQAKRAIWEQIRARENDIEFK
jgi:uncharacterized protein